MLKVWCPELIRFGFSTYKLSKNSEQGVLESLSFCVKLSSLLLRKHMDMLTRTKHRYDTNSLCVSHGNWITGQLA